MTWATIPLGEIALRKGGSVDPKKHPEEVFELYSIPAFDEGTPEIVTGSEIGSSKKLVKPDDVMISRIVPHIRRAWVVGKENGHRQIASGEWITFRGERVWPQYLRWVLVGDEFHTAFMRTVSGVGGSLLRARPAEVYKIEIPLPPLDEQKRIAAILDAADELRAKRRASLALLDDLLQSTFLDMFGDPVTNPMGWESQLLGELTDVGSSKRVFVSDLVKSGVPFYRGTEIGQMGEGTSIQPSLFITQEKYEELKAQSGVPSVGDLLLPSICHDGRIYVVENDSPFYFKDGRVLWIKNDAGAVNSTFLRYHLRQVFRSNYSRIASGTTFAELKIFALKGVQIQTPPLDLQQRFAAIVEAIEQQKARYRAHLDELDTLFASLQSRAFNGEL